MPHTQLSGGQMGIRMGPGGAQFEVAIQKIMEAERRPVQNLEARKAMEQTRLKLFGEFKTRFAGLRAALDEMSSFNKFRELKVDLGTGKDLINVAVDKNSAQPGTYKLEIEDLARRSSMISNEFESPSEKSLGIGYIVVYDNEGDSHEIFIDDNNASLQGVANKINSMPKSPVQASVIQDHTDPDSPYRLIVTAKEDGASKNVDFPDFYFLGGSQDFWIEDDNEAYNALLKVDDFEIETNSNKVPNFLQGVNIELLSSRPGEPFTLTITEDHEKIAGKMKKLVGEINDILAFINKQNQVDESTDTSTTFAGDTGLQLIEYRVRNLLHEGYPADLDTDNFRYKFLHQMGVEIQKDGSVSFDEDKFNTALAADFDGVAQAVTGEFGFARQFGEVMSYYTRPIDGTLAIRERGLQNRIKEIDDRIAREEQRIEQKMKSVTQQFAKVQAAMAGMQQQQAALSAIGSSGGGGLLGQLLG